MEPTRILEQAKAFPFTSIRSYSELDFPEFFEKHAGFIRAFPKGYGFYIWKPHIIYETLKQMKEGEILLYADAGCHLNAKPKALKRFDEYIGYLSDKDIVSFSLNDTYRARSFIKQDAIQFYYPEMNSINPTYLMAGVILMRKSNQTMKMIKEWLNLCTQYLLIDDGPSRYFDDSPWFEGADCDNSLYNLIMNKHNSSCHIVYPDELNMYNEEGIQCTQLPGKESLDWSPLDAFPFHTRRDRPN